MGLKRRHPDLVGPSWCPRFGIRERSGVEDVIVDYGLNDGCQLRRSHGQVSICLRIRRSRAQGEEPGRGRENKTTRAQDERRFGFTRSEAFPHRPSLFCAKGAPEIVLVLADHNQCHVALCDTSCRTSHVCARAHLPSSCPHRITITWKICSSANVTS